MKWIDASGNIWRTRAISPIDAQSKCATPPACTARNVAGSGLHFTAYSTSPGNASTKPRAVASTVAGRRQCIGSSGRSIATSSSTEGSIARVAGKRRRSGVTAERTRRLFNSIILASTWRACAARPTTGMQKSCRAVKCRGDGTQRVLRGLRIAANRSANIGDSLTTPAPRLDRPDEKDALRRCCAPEVSARGSRHVRCVSSRFATWVKRDRAYRAYGG